jgi:hypothetical protein
MPDFASPASMSLHDMATFCWTKSAANTGSRSYWPSLSVSKILLPSPRAATSPPGDGLTVDVTRFIQGLDERHDLGGNEAEAEPDLGVKGKGLFPHRSIPQSPPQWGAPPPHGHAGADRGRHQTLRGGGCPPHDVPHGRSPPRCHRAAVPRAYGTPSEVTTASAGSDQRWRCGVR